MKFKDYLTEATMKVKDASDEQIKKWLKDNPDNMDVYAEAVKRGFAKKGKKFKTSQRFRAGA